MLKYQQLFYSIQSLLCFITQLVKMKCAQMKEKELVKGEIYWKQVERKNIEENDLIWVKLEGCKLHSSHKTIAIHLYVF